MQRHWFWPRRTRRYRTSAGFQHSTCAESSTVIEPPAFERARGEVQRNSQANGPNILSAICVVLVIILVIERPASAKWKSRIKHDGALAVYGATRPATQRR